jgi:hypothetical protein
MVERDDKPRERLHLTLETFALFGRVFFRSLLPRWLTRRQAQAKAINRP